MIAAMKLNGFMVPLPSFASVAITYAEIADWLKVLTLLVGLGTSVVVFMAWLAKRRRYVVEEKIAEAHLAADKVLADAKVAAAKVIADAKLSVSPKDPEL
jgi:hypothetical protein